MYLFHETSLTFTIGVLFWVQLVHETWLMTTVGGRVLRVGRVHAVASEASGSSITALSVAVGGSCAGATGGGCSANTPGSKAGLFALAGTTSTLVGGRAAAGVASTKLVLVLVVSTGGARASRTSS